MDSLPGVLVDLELGLWEETAANPGQHLAVGEGNQVMCLHALGWLVHTTWSITGATMRDLSLFQALARAAERGAGWVMFSPAKGWAVVRAPLSHHVPDQDAAERAVRDA